MKRHAAFLVLVVLTLAGCAGTPKQASATTGEYEYVTPLGSNIPVRVPKGQSAASPTAPSTTVSGEQAERLIHGAGGQVAPDRAGSR